jgi:hypothetical protein
MYVLHFLTFMWSIAFLYLASCPSYATLLQAGQFEVHVVPWLFSCLGSRVVRWSPLRKAIADGGPICVACLAWFYTLSMHTPPLPPPEHC